jgi:hypothetical protein
MCCMLIHEERWDCCRMGEGLDIAGQMQEASGHRYRIAAGVIGDGQHVRFLMVQSQTGVLWSKHCFPQGVQPCLPSRCLLLAVMSYKRWRACADGLAESYCSF